MLDALRAGEVSILLGTQMIAKGLDFPDVTLVGVVNADTALHLPDFRAAERTFQLIAQVAGRTGRGDAGGECSSRRAPPTPPPSTSRPVTTSRPSPPSRQLAERKAFGYPPFKRLLRVILRGPTTEGILERGKELARRLSDARRRRASSGSGPPRRRWPACRASTAATSW